MAKPIGYFCGNSDPAIEKFADLFQGSDNELTLSDRDQQALTAVLAVHAWGCYSGLEEDFWSNVEHAIGDGVETSMESEEDDAPLNVALHILQNMNHEFCYALIQHITQ